MAQESSSTFARTLHDVGIATWFGGTLMGAIGLNGAANAAEDPRERARIVNAGWARWTPVNLAAIGSYVTGGTLLTIGNKGRVASQRGVLKNALIMGGLALGAMAATAYSRVLGQRVIDAQDPPIDSGTTPTDETPPDVEKAQRQLKVLQWAVPGLTGAMLVVNSRMGEQQRPSEFVKGTLRRVLPDRLAA